MSYTTFDYSQPMLSAASLPWDGAIKVRARIANTGTRVGEEVVQLYVHDRVASTTRPVRELKGFRKVRLAPGDSTEVAFELTRQDLAFVGSDGRWAAEPGDFDVWIAPSSNTGTKLRFALRP